MPSVPAIPCARRPRPLLPHRCRCLQSCRTRSSAPAGTCPADVQQSGARVRAMAAGTRYACGSQRQQSAAAQFLPPGGWLEAVAGRPAASLRQPLIWGWQADVQAREAGRHAPDPRAGPAGGPQRPPPAPAARAQAPQHAPLCGCPWRGRLGLRGLPSAGRAVLALQHCCHELRAHLRRRCAGRWSYSAREERGLALQLAREVGDAPTRFPRVRVQPGEVWEAELGSQRVPMLAVLPIHLAAAQPPAGPSFVS